MATNTEQLARRAQSMERDLSRLADSGVSAVDLAAPLQEYRLACENVIFADFEGASARGIEKQLWNVHLKVNGAFRKELKLVKRNNRDHVVEYRKLAKHYLQFIKASQRFYRQYILNLDAQFDRLPELRKIAQKWKDDVSKTALRARIPASSKPQVLLSCHQTLIQLGDLSRYRETELVEKERNWGPATGYYGLAWEINPDSGQSHNQLAVIAREDGNHFRSTYHLYRSLASKEPHPLARQNLELGFKKIVTAWSRGELISNRTSPDGNTAGRALVAWFIRLHSKCYSGKEFAQHDELENEVLSQLTIELKERSLDSILSKIILINLAAEYYATVQMAESPPPENIMQTYFYYLRLNVKTFFTLLQILQSELERLSEGDDVKDQNGTRASHLSDKITAVARRILPGLRLYSTWFTRYHHILSANVADTLTTVEVQELWKAYAATLTLLASSFPPEQLPNQDYMLEEDTDTIGFQPLISEETIKRWYNGNILKQKWTDLERNHPNVEMLMRVRDLMVDGLLLIKNHPEAPLEIDNMRFIYREAGLPSELLASPNNRLDGSPAIPAAEPVDFPLFPQEELIADDQKSYSVAAASESASTTLAKDPAMNRMVDDLVGPDDGLDPLPEEDENIPPTPPEQTFEDTTMVTDTSYGIGPLTVSDFVNAVQNYSKPLGSPATPIFATPMGRAPSSSSIRQPANLPSLPDGQSNGNSIWNRNYNGTPGPSSPLIGGGSGVRGSPLSGMHASVASGHVRGDSSNSLRSSDWTSTPVQRPVSGGLGSGAAWGSSSASVYNSIYGNSWNRAVNSTDLNILSPFLFEKDSAWNPDIDGRTPPPGQGG
ncbi:uncharacterized protein BDR25DRAFT_328068 [Lindgomyces ingoldianus]|uniref:Uncharacterized protein n=1 Tax=Lindgomyces ingoldianus TaxID=673940 RepID=A0ACB6QH77_9PLEO|nr:uncharacterized protein BDR25DRAFT_328068 [Lindgomyces ingoldianus]KAF2466338.1 hypothetical protein BDR25DRAFT_328068 [Lindgomyces ingoldianus]